MATKKAKTTKAKQVDVAETEAQQVEVITRDLLQRLNSLTLAVMASTGCDETTALARIKHAEQQVLKERELAAAAPQS